MNNTSAVEVSIHAVSPELILDESTLIGSVGAAGAAAAAPDASDVAAACAEEADALVALPGSLAVAPGPLAAIDADAATGADASSARARPAPPASSDPAIRNVISFLRMLSSSLLFRSLWPVRARVPFLLALRSCWCDVLMP
jgi:hypothetical protein